MRREANIPLFLWLASGALVHLVGGGGAEHGARLIDERLDVGRFAAGVRSHVRLTSAPPLEIEIVDEAAPEEAVPEEPKADPAQDESAEPEDDQTPEQVTPKPETAPQAAPEPTAKLTESEPHKPDEPALNAEKKPPAVAEQKPLPELVLPKKIAVRQHLDDEKQADNPEANQISDKANRVAEETQARITSADQNDAKPTPGSAPSGPAEAPGNAEETRVMQDSDQEGTRGRAPGGVEAERAERTAAAAPELELGHPSAAAPGAPGARAARPAETTPPAATETNQVARAATPERLGAPEVIAGNSGSFAVSRAEAPTPEQRAQRAKKRLPPRRPRSLLDTLGLGAAGLSPGGVALNLTPHMAHAAIGSEQLSRLRHADGERRRSQHRGSWKTPGIERFRSAIENYVPSVKPGNQTALNTARVPFAAYLNQIHNLLHPIFADAFLGSLDSLPSAHPMNDPKLITSLEIVVEREEGRLVRRGVTRTSGVTAFDISAIESVDRAAPFGVPPAEIVSPDGNVYLHWEFHRGQMACSTFNAHPYILKVQPRPAPMPAVPPLPPFRGPDETPNAPNQGRHGFLGPLGRPAAPRDG